MIAERTKRRLAAARDLLAVAVFLAIVFFGGRAFLGSVIFRKERVTKAEAKEDISVFFDEAAKERPATPGAVPDYSGLKARALAGAAPLLDNFGRLNTLDLARILFKAAASLGDPDTRLYWRYPRYNRDPEKKFPPFLLASRSGKFFIAEADDRTLNGAELLSADGKPFGEFLRPALALIPGQTKAYRAYAFCRDQSFWWNFSGLLSGGSQLELKARTAGGRTVQRTLPLITAMEFRRFVPRTHAQQLRFYSRESAAWLRLYGLEYSRAESKELSDFFSSIRASGVRNLVLDLRDSGGGDPRMADRLLALIYGGTYGKPGEAGARFSRKLTVVIGPGTAGPAALLAARLKGKQNVELLGERTGGGSAFYYAPETRRLPASGLRYTVSTGYCPGDTAPVAPELELTPALLSRYRGMETEFVLSRLFPKKEKTAHN